MYRICDDRCSAAGEKRIVGSTAERIYCQTADKRKERAQSRQSGADQQLQVFIVRFVEIPAAEEFLCFLAVDLVEYGAEGVRPTAEQRLLADELQRALPCEHTVVTEFVTEIAVIEDLSELVEHAAFFAFRGKEGGDQNADHCQSVNRDTCDQQSAAG